MTEGPAAVPYSPERRTAVVLCGTGTHGAYHAGVLRALHEAGVKIDLVAGQGIGAAGAALAALDGAARLWEPGGIWRSPAAATFYGWKRSLRAAVWLLLLLAAVVAAPLAVLAAGLLAQVLAFLAGMFSEAAGAAIVGAYTGALAVLLGPSGLPAIVPPLAVVIILALLLALVGGALYEGWRHPGRRRVRGWWWRSVTAPLDAEGARLRVLGVLRDLLQDDATLDRSAREALGRRYAEIISENLGHPGFRELIVVATDLDARRDIVGVLLGEPWRSRAIVSWTGGELRADVVDLTGAGRDLVFDLVAAGATPAVGCDPHLVTFAPDGYWRGETHRLCDRPAAVSRLIEEVAAAGATQVIVVSAVSASLSPHRLRPPRLDLPSRLGEVFETDTSAALRDAVEAARARLETTYLICPSHNPVGPFDFAGAYDQLSDRWHSLEELVERGYDDAGRQFIGPILGASGEHLVDHGGATAPPGPESQADRNWA